MPVMSGFYFSVVFELLPQFSIDTKFQSLSGIGVTMETESVAEGGQNRYKYDLPTYASYDDLVLKRGMTKDLSGLKIWSSNAIENFVFHPANIVISLLNEKGVPTKVWYISQAIPKSIKTSNFDAEEGSLVIETFTLSYQYFKEIPIP